MVRVLGGGVKIWYPFEVPDSVISRVEDCEVICVVLPTGNWSFKVWLLNFSDLLF